MNKKLTVSTATDFVHVLTVCKYSVTVLLAFVAFANCFAGTAWAAKSIFQSKQGKSEPPVYAYVLSFGPTSGFNPDLNARIFPYRVVRQAAGCVALSRLSPGSIRIPPWPTPVAVSPTGRIAVLGAAVNGNDLAVFRIQPDGTLKRAAGEPAVPPAATALEFSTDSRFLFVSDTLGSIFTVRVGKNGRLRRVPGQPMQGGFEPFQMATTTDGKFLYVLVENKEPLGYGHSINGYSIGHDGILTRLSPFDIGLGVLANSLAVDPGGKYLYATDIDGLTTFTITKNGSLRIFAKLNQNPTRDPTESISQEMLISRSGRFGYSLETKPRIGEIMLDYYTEGHDGTLMLASRATIDMDGRLTDPNSPTAASAAIGGDGEMGGIAIRLDPSGTHLMALDHLFNRILVYGLDKNGAVLGSAPQSSIPCHYPIDATFVERH